MSMLLFFGSYLKEYYTCTKFNSLYRSALIKEKTVLKLANITRKTLFKTMAIAEKERV